jgi:hypothetical protein
VAIAAHKTITVWQLGERVGSVYYCKMSKKLPLSDFRAARSKLEPDEFAFSDGQDVPPSDLVDEEVWDGMPREIVKLSSEHHAGRSLMCMGPSHASTSASSERMSCSGTSKPSRIHARPVICARKSILIDVPGTIVCKRGIFAVTPENVLRCNTIEIDSIATKKRQ